ncbi:MAG: hypothetical protein ACQEVA_18225 [Myxococcota bacterium]
MSDDISLVSIDMGYGHLRAAHPLADALDTELLYVDEPPLADTEDQTLWGYTRKYYEGLTRISTIPMLGAPMEYVVDEITAIEPLHPRRDLSAPNGGVQVLDRAAEFGLGQGMVERLREGGSTLLTTFYSPAIIADRAGCEDVFCVVTDSDINRVWAPLDGSKSNIQYLTPSRRASRRMEAYGVRPENIHFTGFPLPPELLGGPDLPVARKDLAARLVRLDRNGVFREQYGDILERELGELPEEQAEETPRLLFAIGGAGAQVELAAEFLPGIRDAILDGELELTLVAGVRDEVKARFKALLRGVGLLEALGGPVEILHEPTFEPYYRRFNQRLRTTDILWTKPSEMTFYGGLGMAMLFSPAVGVHEKYNRRWAVEAGAGLVQRELDVTWDWLTEWLEDGTLAAAAWSGFMRLPTRGTYRIAELVGD